MQYSFAIDTLSSVQTSNLRRYSAFKRRIFMTLSKMQTSTIENVDATNGALQQARSLVPPSRDETLKRAPSVQRFWDGNHLLLENAWHEWDEQNEQLAEWVTENLISEPLRNAVTLAWEDPAKEQAVANLWEEVLHGVYQAQLFDVEKLWETL